MRDIIQIQQLFYYWYQFSQFFQKLLHFLIEKWCIIQLPNWFKWHKRTIDWIYFFYNSKFDGKIRSIKLFFLKKVLLYLSFFIVASKTVENYILSKFQVQSTYNILIKAYLQKIFFVLYSYPKKCLK